jgi:hypothetical protein
MSRSLVPLTTEKLTRWPEVDPATTLGQAQAEAKSAVAAGWAIFLSFDVLLRSNQMYF